MKRLLGVLTCIVLVVSLIYACSDNSKYEATEDQMIMMSGPVDEDLKEMEYNKAKSKNTIAFTAPIVKNFLATQAAAQDMDIIKRPLIKTAKLRFKVKDVVNSSYGIEARALGNEGYILQSNITSQESGYRSVRMSADSSLIIRNYEIKGDLVIRVPQENLYTFLDEIAKEATLIDYRLLNAKDLTLDLFANSLEEKRLDRKTRRMGTAIATRSGKLADAVEAEEALDAAEQHADNVKISEFRMQDDMKLSTVTIEIYQDELEYKEVVKNTEQIDEYEPGLGHHIKNALLSGWNGFCSIFIFVVNLWPLLILLVAIGYIIYRNRKNKKKE